MSSKFIKPKTSAKEQKEPIPPGAVAIHRSFINGKPGRYDGLFVAVLSVEEIKDGDKVKHKYEVLEPRSNKTFKFEDAAPRHKLEIAVSKNKNLPPRTLPALRAVMLLNHLHHKPKSVIIQTDNEVVVQVRGDFEKLVKKLRKIFKSKGKDTSAGVLYQHDWKLRNFGLMSVIWNEHNDYMSVRFLSIPGLGVREVQPDPEEETKSEAAAKATAHHLESAKTVQADLIPENLDAVTL